MVRMKWGFAIRNRVLLAALAGFALGTLWLAAVRFVRVRDTAVHYHANFALYVNGQRDPFDSFTFYEEVQACSGQQHNNPKGRVHMHGKVNSVVHVHDHAATWGHFFANLGYGLTDTSLKTDAGTFVDGHNGKRLRFLLNGRPVESVANRTIGSEDVLLVSFGDEDETALRRQYDTITRDAGRYNQQTDPASCSGGQPLTLSERLKRAFVGE